MTIEGQIGGWSYKFQNTFLKSRRGLRISYLAVDRKKEFIKKLCLPLKREILSLVLVLYVELLARNFLDIGKLSDSNGT